VLHVGSARWAHALASLPLSAPRRPPTQLRQPTFRAQGECPSVSRQGKWSNVRTPASASDGGAALPAFARIARLRPLRTADRVALHLSPMLDAPRHALPDAQLSFLCCTHTHTRRSTTHPFLKAAAGVSMCVLAAAGRRLWKRCSNRASTLQHQQQKR